MGCCDQYVRREKDVSLIVYFHGAKSALFFCDVDRKLRRAAQGCATYAVASNVAAGDKRKGHRDAAASFDGLDGPVWGVWWLFEPVKRCRLADDDLLKEVRSDRNLPGEWPTVSGDQ